MRIRSIAGKLLALLVLLAVGVDAQAGSLQARIARLHSSQAEMVDVVATLEWPADAPNGKLRLQVGSLSVPMLGYRAEKLSWQCPLARKDGAWTCDGRIDVKGGAPPARLRVALSPASTDALLVSGDRKISVENLAASPDRFRITVERLPIAWLQAFLSSLWADGRWTAGTLDGKVDLSTPANGPLVASVDAKVRDLGVETPAGDIAAASVAGRLEIAYRNQGDDTRVEARFSPRGGEFLAGNFYASLPAAPAAPLQMQVTATQHGSQGWSLPQLRWSDPGVLELTGSADLDRNTDPENLDIRYDLADLAVAQDRYLSGFLAPAGFADLALAGGIDGRMTMVLGRLGQVDARFHDVNAVDRQGRFVLAGVAGDLAWQAGDEAVASRLGWRSGALFGIGLGTGDFALSSARGEVKLTQPTAIEVLDGRIRLNHLTWQAPGADRGTEFDLGVAMENLDLGSLSQRLGWPPFSGRIDGRIPSAHFKDNILRLDGGLEMDLFDGHVNLSNMVMERPFGVAPTLSANVQISDIDLEPMTKVFGFGSITGRLDGHIDELRLLDWSPVAFDAWLQTDRQWKGKRRISQRAVNDISSVGGSGLIAGVQAKLLSIFNDFGYDQIGLGCKLKDNVCRMEGVGSAGDGYIIVAGAGLPRIQVVGFRRQVDWPTLVARLKAATQGQTPVIQ